MLLELPKYEATGRVAPFSPSPAITPNSGLYLYVRSPNTRWSSSILVEDMNLTGSPPLSTMVELKFDKGSGQKDGGISLGIEYHVGSGLFYRTTVISIGSRYKIMNMLDKELSLKQVIISTLVLSTLKRDRKTRLRKLLSSLNHLHLFNGII